MVTRKFERATFNSIFPIDVCISHLSYEKMKLTKISDCVKIFGNFGKDKTPLSERSKMADPGRSAAKAGIIFKIRLIPNSCKITFSENWICQAPISIMLRDALTAEKRDYVGFFLKIGEGSPCFYSIVFSVQFNWGANKLW